MSNCSSCGDKIFFAYLFGTPTGGFICKSCLENMPRKEFREMKNETSEVYASFKRIDAIKEDHTPRINWLNNQRQPRIYHIRGKYGPKMYSDEHISNVLLSAKARAIIDGRQLQEIIDLFKF